jgi:glycosyltransferase involved in cell wall biosynthesis
VYNKADTIRASIESIYAQTFSDYETVVVDDGSTDDIVSVLQELASVALRVIRQENGGVSVARNTGIDNAKGEYICFLDADDLWMKDHLSVLNGLIEKYHSARTYVTSHEVRYPDGKNMHSADALGMYGEDFETDNLIGLLNNTAYTVVHTNSMCAKRSLLTDENIRFEPKIKIGEDTDVWFRLGLKYPVAVTKKETTLYRREYSTASRGGTHVQNWIFLSRVEGILSDDTVSDAVKNAVIELVDRYKMTASREYMVENNRADAKRVLSEVTNKKGRRYLLTRVLTFCPYFVCRKLLKR